MKNLFLNNWMAKLASLLLAIAIWFLIKRGTETMVISRGFFEPQSSTLLPTPPPKR